MMQSRTHGFSKRTMIRSGALAVVASVALSGCEPTAKSTPPPTPTPTPTTIRSMDELQQMLANRAEQIVGKADDFKIVVTTFQYPIGTLIRPTGAMAADYTGCAPKGPLITSPAPSIFPSYRLTSAVAAAFDLDPGVLAPVVGAGAHVDFGRTVDVAFKDVSGTVLSDHDIKTILAQPSCAAALEDGPYLYIRGYIQGVRTFKIAATNAGAVKATVAKVGKFDVSASSDTMVLLSDDTARGFLAVVSQMKQIPAAVPTPTPSAGVPTPTVTPTPAGTPTPVGTPTPANMTSLVAADGNQSVALAKPALGARVDNVFKFNRGSPAAITRAADAARARVQLNQTMVLRGAAPAQ